MTPARVDVLDEAGGGWRRLVLTAPPGNLLSLAMVRMLADAVETAAHLPGLRWLTVEGAGGEFCYGASIPEHLPDPMREVLPATHALLRQLLAFPAPTAALVDGRCLGGGFELALACDDIIASAAATFGMPEVALGAFPPAGAALLPVRVGASRAARAIVAGDTKSAGYWHDAGLVSIAAESAGLLDAARGWFDGHLAPHSAVALSQAALAARAVWRPAVERAIAEGEARYLEMLRTSEDAVEGITAWMEKRRPEWRDR